MRDDLPDESRPGLRIAASPCAEFDAFLALRRFPALDGLRALSILAVLWHHSAAGYGGFPASSNGFLGVDMFFVLSGFLIVTLLLRERRLTGSVSLRAFYARRSLRIFPIYYLVLGGVLVLVTVVHPSSAMRAPFLRELPFHLTYSTNWIQSSTFLAIAWSLAAEEQFYLCWPPVEKYLPRASLCLLGLAIVANQLVNFQVLDGFLESGLGLDRAEYAILQITFTPICLGVLLAHALDRPAGFARLHGALGNRAAPWVLLVALAAACNVPGDISGAPRLVIQVTMTLFLAACVLGGEHALARGLARPFLRRIGAISYGMYLYHHPARYVAVALLAGAGVASPPVLFAVCTLLTLLLAEASFRWIETPIARLGRVRAASLPSPVAPA